MSLAFSPVAAGRRAGFGLALAGIGLMMGAAAAPSPFYPVLAARIGFSAAAMTGIFAIYAGALLATLLIAGSVSDHLGRRPVISAGFVLLAASMAVFGAAGSVAGLMLARVLQGVASGLLLSTLTATSTDFAPEGRPGVAATWNAVVPMLGLGAGALAAGALLGWAADPRGEAFAALAAGSAALAGLIWAVPETAPRAEGLWAALRPRVGVPAPARAAFRRSAPAVAAGWATGGLYLSLGAPVVARLFGVGSELAQGAVVALLCATGALACWLARGMTARRVTLLGTDALALGTALTLAAIWSGGFGFYLASVAVAGVGFGTCFTGVLRSITPTVQAEERGELFAALFTLSYAAFGLPALAAGLLLPAVGLEAVVLGYGAAILAFALIAGGLRRWGTAD